jgi:hypothetical protein
MRWTFWRRAAAVLAVIVGVGIGASGVSASAASVGSPGHATSKNAPNDWWW